MAICTINDSKLLWFLELPVTIIFSPPFYVKLFRNVPFIFIIFLVNRSADKNRCSTQSTPAFALVYETVHFLVKPNGFISVAGDWFFVSSFISAYVFCNVELVLNLNMI